MARPKRNFTVVAGIPPKAAVEHISNWIDESDQIEAQIRPQRQQSVIDDDTRFSTADVWFPGERSTVALLKLIQQGRVIAMDVFENDVVWRLHRNVKNTWWVDRHRNPLSVTLNDSVRFPLRYCSRLKYDRRPLLGIINPGGAGGEWVFETD